VTEPLAPTWVTLAERLREDILSARLSEGDPLPSEWALVEESGLTRAGVRRALAALAADGLIRTRPGNNGGSVVAKPNRAALVANIEVFLRTHSAGDDETVLEAREAIEPWAAALAARRRSADDMERLDAANERMEAGIEDLALYLRANLDWHRAVATASGNSILVSFMDAISRAVEVQTDSAEFNTMDVRRTAIRAHRRVTEAIAQQDADAAQRRMSRHVHGFGEAYLADPHRHE
jgi:DNA-binding FadR family transcriptional regulator